MYWSDSGKFEPNPTLMALFERAHQEKMEELRSQGGARRIAAHANLLNALTAAALRPSQAYEAMARGDALRAQSQAIPAQINEYNARAGFLNAQTGQLNEQTNALADNTNFGILGDISNHWNKTHGQLPPKGIGQQYTFTNPQQSNGSLYDTFTNYQFPSTANSLQTLINENNNSNDNNDNQAAPSQTALPPVNANND
jgi:hypothetical protein